jgi:hypothetical protein
MNRPQIVQQPDEELILAFARYLEIVEEGVDAQAYLQGLGELALEVVRLAHFDARIQDAVATPSQSQMLRGRHALQRALAVRPEERRSRHKGPRLLGAVAAIGLGLGAGAAAFASGAVPSQPIHNALEVVPAASRAALPGASEHHGDATTGRPTGKPSNHVATGLIAGTVPGVKAAEQGDAETGHASMKPEIHASKEKDPPSKRTAPPTADPPEKAKPDKESAKAEKADPPGQAKKPSSEAVPNSPAPADPPPGPAALPPDTGPVAGPDEAPFNQASQAAEGIGPDGLPPGKGGRPPGQAKKAPSDDASSASETVKAEPPGKAGSNAGKGKK